MKGDILEPVSSFKYLRNCFNEGGGLQEDVTLRTFGQMKKMFNVIV